MVKLWAPAALWIFFTLWWLSCSKSSEAWSFESLSCQAGPWHQTALSYKVCATLLVLLPTVSDMRLMQPSCKPIWNLAACIPHSLTAEEYVLLAVEREPISATGCHWTEFSGGLCCCMADLPDGAASWRIHTEPSVHPSLVHWSLLVWIHSWTGAHKAHIGFYRFEHSNMPLHENLCICALTCNQCGIFSCSETHICCISRL